MRESGEGGKVPLPFKNGARRPEKPDQAEGWCLRECEAGECGVDTISMAEAGDERDKPSTALTRRWRGCGDLVPVDESEAGAEVIEGDPGAALRFLGHEDRGSVQLEVFRRKGGGAAALFVPVHR